MYRRRTHIMKQNYVLNTHKKQSRSIAHYTDIPTIISNTDQAKILNENTPSIQYLNVKNMRDQDVTFVSAAFWNDDELKAKSSHHEVEIRLQIC